MANFYSTEVEIICVDQYAIAATIYTPQEALKGAILIGPATEYKDNSMQALLLFLQKKAMA